MFTWYLFHSTSFLHSLSRLNLHGDASNLTAIASESCVVKERSLPRKNNSREGQLRATQGVSSSLSPKGLWDSWVPHHCWKAVFPTPLSHFQSIWLLYCWHSWAASSPSVSSVAPTFWRSLTAGWRHLTQRWLPPAKIYGRVLLWAWLGWFGSSWTIVAQLSLLWSPGIISHFLCYGLNWMNHPRLTVFTPQFPRWEMKIVLLSFFHREVVLINILEVIFPVSIQWW